MLKERSSGATEYPTHINLLLTDDNRRPKGRKIFKVSKFMVYVLSILLITFFIFTYEVLFTTSSFIDSIGNKVSIFKQLTSIVTGSTDLRGIEDDRINILLLGIGGEGHDGPNLTDTILVASIKPSTKKVSLISIPRDLLVTIPGKGAWKINQANHFGEQSNPGNGGELASETTSSVLGLPIHYYLRIDFDGFAQLIDDIGGVKIFVERSFTDSLYPTEDHLYQTITFHEGWQTMDGDMALKYARSRHGNNGEGSDFARARRQQKVIQSLKERILTYDTLFNPRLINKLIKSLGEHLRTNIELSHLVELYQLSRDLDMQNIHHEVLDDAPGGFLYPAKVNEAYVLQPVGGDFTRIQAMAQTIFNEPITTAPKTQLSFEVLNGTGSNGLAFNISKQLKTLGFKIIKIGNADNQNYNKTIIYNFNPQETGGDQSLKTLAEQFSAKIETDIPGWLRDTTELTTDCVIILGATATQ